MSNETKKPVNSQQKMSNEMKKPINGTGSVSGSGGFRARLNYYLHSGEKKHVFAGIVIIGVISGVPFYFMTRGTKQHSHQDYMEKAEKANKARSERLSAAGTTTIR